MKKSQIFEDQFVLSIELIQLLHWLTVHEHDALQKLVTRALKHRAAKKHDEHAVASSEEMHDAVVHFFVLLQSLIQKHTETDRDIQQLNAFRMPTLSKIHSSDYDAQALARSIAKASDAFDEGTEDPREVLYRELLKQWHPQSKQKNIKH